MSEKAESLNKKIEVKILLVGLAVFVIFVFLISRTMFLEPTITGLVTVTEQINYTDIVNLEFTESGAYIWNLQNPGELKSIRIDGSKSKQGTAKVYIEKDNIRYLLFDGEQLVEDEYGISGITGLVIGELNTTLNETIDEIVVVEDIAEINETVNDVVINETFVNDSVEINETTAINETVNETITNETTAINETIVDEIIINETVINESVEINKTTNQTTEDKTIYIELEYKTGTNWDINNDGIESLDGVIDFTVENSGFNWNVDESKLCTRWETYSEEQEESTFICHGSTECCGFVELQPTLDEWDDLFDLYKGRFYDSKQYVIGAQLIYVDIDLENLEYDVVYSDPEILSAAFEEGLILFEDECIDTCSINGFDQDSYKLIVVIDNATLRIDEIKYIIEKKVAKPKENLICKDFEDNVLWSSGYSLLPEGSTSYNTWNIRTNCAEAGGNNCFLQNVSISTRTLYVSSIDLNGSGESYIQLSNPDDSICDIPEQGVYSRYLSFETLAEEGKKRGWYCGKNKNPNAKCGVEIASNYNDNVTCYGIKAYASQYSLIDAFKVKYTWCWVQKELKDG